MAIKLFADNAINATPDTPAKVVFPIIKLMHTTIKMPISIEYAMYCPRFSFSIWAFMAFWLVSLMYFEFSLNSLIMIPAAPVYTLS